MNQSIQDKKYAANLRKQELQKELDAINQEIFADMSKELFAKFPSLDSFTWTQYTPYFNDGDECIFGVDEEPRDVVINGIELDPDNIWIRTSDWDSATKQYIPYSPEKIQEVNKNDLQLLASAKVTHEEYVAIIGAISEFLSEQDEDLMKETFGDHAIVTLFKDGTSDSDGYDHD